MSDTSAVTDQLRRALIAGEGGRRCLRRGAMAGGFAILIAGGVVWRIKHRPPPPAKFVTSAVTTGDVAEKVQATGAVQPLLQINIGAQVNGRVTKVLVDFNSAVKKGDVLAEIDPSILGTQVSAQAANLSGQRAQFVQAKAQMETSRAQMETARVAFERVERLYKAGLSSKGDLDTAVGNYSAAKATFDAAA